MRFDSKATTKAALEDGGFQLLPDGDYDAEILECEEKSDKKGNPMLALKLSIKDPEGRSFSYHVYDHVSPHWFQHKFVAFFESMGKKDMYESGDIDPALIVGQYVTATITTEPASDKYPAKNTVEGYILAEVSAAKKAEPAARAEAAKDDGLPF